MSPHLGCDLNPLQTLKVSARCLQDESAPLSGVTSHGKGPTLVVRRFLHTMATLYLLLLFSGNKQGIDNKYRPFVY